MNGSWKDVMHEYRILLAEEGQAADQNEPLQLGESKEKRRKKAKGYSKEIAKKIIDAGGKLTWVQLLRCKTRYFTDGVALGSQSFVNDYFSHLKDKSSAFEKRDSGARQIKRADGPPLFSFRDLKKDVIQISDLQ